MGVVRGRGLVDCCARSVVLWVSRAPMSWDAIDLVQHLPLPRPVAYSLLSSITIQQGFVTPGSTKQPLIATQHGESVAKSSRGEPDKAGESRNWMHARALAGTPACGRSDDKLRRRSAGCHDGGSSARDLRPGSARGSAIEDGEVGSRGLRQRMAPTLRIRLRGRLVAR